jgi:prevent-host-death family protein
MPRAKSTASPTLDEVVDEVVRNREPVVIHRKKKPVAVVVPIEDLELIERLEDELDIREARKARKEKTVPWGQVKKELGLYPR